MPKLTLEAKVCNVILQDPFPAEGLLVVQLVPGTPQTKYVTWSQFQRLRLQLASLEALGNLLYSVEAVAGEDIRTMESDLLGLPEIQLLDTASTPLTAGGPVVGAKLLGTNLLGGQIKAFGTKGNLLDTNGYLTITALIPGADGNAISCEFVDGAAEAVSVLVNKITVTLDTGVSDYASIAALLSSDPATVFMVTAVEHGTGATKVSAEAETFLSGGIGGGATLSIGGIPAVFEGLIPGQVTYDIYLTTATAGDTAIGEYRCGGKVVRFTVVFA
jgi:hypothetical protein